LDNFAARTAKSLLAVSTDVSIAVAGANRTIRISRD